MFLGVSMTKSVLAHLVGRAVRDGALALTDAVTSHVPELAGTGYDGTPVLDVLTMTTGVDWVEDHRNSEPRLPAARAITGFRDPVDRGVQNSSTPPSRTLKKYGPSVANHRFYLLCDVDPGHDRVAGRAVVVQHGFRVVRTDLC